MIKPELKFDFSEGERYIELNGIKHWVKIAGVEKSTIPLVYVHGGPGGNSYAFENTIGPKLEEFTTVIYYDQRGCGRSDTPKDVNEYSFDILSSDLSELCKELHLQKIIPLGHSFGGQLVFEFALQYPHLVEKIIAEAPTIFFENSRNELIQMYGFEVVSAGSVKQKIQEIFSSTNFPVYDKHPLVWLAADYHAKNKFMFYHEENALKARKIWKNNQNLKSNMPNLPFLKSVNKISILDRVSSIEIPTLILVGLYDRNVGLDIPRDYADKIKNSKFEIFEKSAHYPEIEEPEKFLKVIKEFLN